MSTIGDELHRRSMYVLSGFAVLFVLMLRGCFENDVVVNGRLLDGPTVGWHASLTAFHLIAAAGVVIGILLSMRVLQRDRENGTVVAVMSKPVRRIEYITAKVAGVWLLAYGFTFLLHMTVYFIMLFSTGGRISFFIPASFMISLNVLLIVVAVMLLSEFLPDTAAALLGGLVWLVGLMSDGLYAAAQHRMVRSILEQVHTADQGVALWRVVWPKMTALQLQAVSMIRGTTSYWAGPLDPVLNVACYTAALFLLLWLRFSKEEIS